MRAAGEPSVEEILESIKKVIARDNRSDAEQVRRRREQEGIVVTTSPISDRTPVEQRFYADDEPTPVLELTDAQLVPPTDDGEEKIVPYPEQAGDAQADVDESAQEGEPLTAQASRSSVRETLAALQILAEPGARPQIVRSGETSLEGLTRDLLKPMLAEWLDKNLPGMVDRLVAAEISRIVGKRG